MKIYLLTYGRVNRQLTLDNMPERTREDITVVCHRSELSALQEVVGGRVNYLPHSIVGSSAVREFIFEYHWENENDPRFLMLDDDVRFCFRGESGKLIPFASFDEDGRAELFRGMFSEIEESLSSYALSGVLTRGFSNHRDPGVRWYLNQRFYAVWGGNARVLKENNISFNRITYADDYDVMMQVLEAGLDFAAMNYFLMDAAPPPMGTNPGGEWTLDRFYNIERKFEQYQKLSELHPGKVAFWMKKGVDPDEMQPQDIKLRINWRKFGRFMGPIKEVEE